MLTREASNDGQEVLASGSAPGLAATENVPMSAENTQPGSPSLPQPIQPPKTFFGLGQDARREGFPRPIFNDDYVARFPEDPYGQETAPNARVYRVYVEEAAAFDENMVGQSRDGLDVMLVFAGLFSAVVTSFLVQASQNLQADFSEMSALLLHDLLIVQLAMVDGATVNVTTPSINPAEKFEPDAIDVWVNGLWVVSLTTSLVVALAAVLMKQWLHRYMTFPSGTPGLRSHVRQFRFMGLEKWRVRIIIGILPILMHVSLILFFAGLALFFIPLRISLAWAVGSFAVMVCVLYLVSNTIPIVFPQCPYQTPLTDFIYHLCQFVRFGIHSFVHWLETVYQCFVACRGDSRLATHHSLAVSSEVFQRKWKSFIQLESDAVQKAHDTLSVDALDGLYHMSSNPTVHSIVLQGISGLPAASRSYAGMKWSGAWDMQSQRRQLIQASSPRGLLDQPWVLERLSRSCLFLPRAFHDEDFISRVGFLAEPRDGDPRIKATIWVAFRWLTIHEALPFFASYSDVPMHPLIWETIIRFVLSVYLRIPDIDKCSFAHFLRAIIGPPSTTSSSPTASASLMTATQVVWTRLQPEIWDTLLQVPLLKPHDRVPVGSISLYHRTLIATGRLALSHVLDNHHNFDHFTTAHCPHPELLACVAKLVADSPDSDVTPDTDRAQWTAVFDFVCCIIMGTRDITLASIESQKGGNPLLECLEAIRGFYYQSSFLPEFHFPGLDCLLQTWTGFYDCSQYDSEFTEGQLPNLWMPMDILGRALFCGHEEAHRIFRDNGWIEIVFTEWAICGGIRMPMNRVVNGYIGGLYTLTSDLARREFCEYLHQPQQLVLSFMLIVAASAGSWNPVYSLLPLVIQLTKICPTHTSWRECHTELNAILAWARTPTPEIPLFPWPPSLQSLSVTAAFRKYPLVDWTARRFSSSEMREGLEAGLGILHGILENTEAVEGVLIPDLENQPSIHAIPGSSIERSLTYTMHSTRGGPVLSPVSPSTGRGLPTTTTTCSTYLY